MRSLPTNRTRFAAAGLLLIALLSTVLAVQLPVVAIAQESPAGTPVSATESPSGEPSSIAGAAPASTSTPEMTPAAVLTETPTVAPRETEPPAPAQQSTATALPTAATGISIAADKATPTLALALTAGSIDAGGSVSGIATLTGTAPAAGGTVTYTVYAGQLCQTPVTPAMSSVKTVVNGAVPGSDPLVFNVIGSYSWSAVYSGDAGNNTAASACIALTVNRASPMLTLATNPSPVAIDLPVAGVGMLTGQTATAGGTITYTVYRNHGLCTAGRPAVNTSTKTVANGVAPQSDPFTFSDFETYWWKAIYSGDANNNGAEAPCIEAPVGKALPKLMLTITPSPIEIGGTAIGSITMTGATASASGSVVYTVYSDDACKTPVNPSQTSTQAVTNGAVPNSSKLSFPSSGTFYWKVEYNGDAKNTAAASECVPLIVKASPALTLSFSPNPAQLGGQLSFHAALAAAAPGPTGTVTIAMFGDSACIKTLAGYKPVTITLVKGAIPDPAPITLSMTDAYVMATYSGDANNDAAVTPCQAIPVARDLDLSVAVGPDLTMLSGESTLAYAGWPAGDTPAGTIAYTLYAGSGCSGAIVYGPEAVTISSTGAPSSTAVQIVQAGDYSWLDEFSGDGHYNPAAACQSILVKATPALSIEAIPPSPAVGQWLTGRAALSADAYAPTGTVTYTVYTDSSCLQPFQRIAPQTKSLIDGQIPDSDPMAVSSPGTLYLDAYYSGDRYNAPLFSGCARVDVMAGSLTVSITSASLSPVTYSSQTTTSTGQIVIAVNDQRGTRAGWSVSLSSGDFTSPSSTIPNDLLSITAAGQPIGSAGPYAGPNATGSLGEARVVAIAQPGSGAGVYQQVINIALRIPPYTPVGTYTATLVVATVAAP